MSDRYTRKDAEQAVRALCKALGRPYGDYVYSACASNGVDCGRSHVFVSREQPKEHIEGNGGLALDYAPVYGGCSVVELRTGGTGQWQPFGSVRLPCREFVAAVRMAVDAVEMYKSTDDGTSGRIWREDTDTLSAEFWCDDEDEAAQAARDLMREDG